MNFEIAKKELKGKNFLPEVDLNATKKGYMGGWGYEMMMKSSALAEG